MNDTINTILTRYSCRDCSPQMPADGLLTAITAAAIASPSSRNLQPWRVILVKDPALLADMEAEGLKALAAQPDQTMYERILSRGGTLFYHAPCMVMIAIDPADVPGAALDCGIVAQTVSLAASSLGLGNVICGLGGLAFAGARATEFEQRLDFPEGFAFGMCVLIGHANGAGVPHEPDAAKVSVIG